MEKQKKQNIHQRARNNKHINKPKQNIPSFKQKIHVDLLSTKQNKSKINFFCLHCTLWCTCIITRISHCSHNKNIFFHHLIKKYHSTIAHIVRTNSYFTIFINKAYHHTYHQYNYMNVQTNDHQYYHQYYYIIIAVLELGLTIPHAVTVHLPKQWSVNETRITNEIWGTTM